LIIRKAIKSDEKIKVKEEMKEAGILGNIKPQNQGK
jgi:hypothetical protein